MHQESLTTKNIQMCARIGSHLLKKIHDQPWPNHWHRNKPNAILFAANDLGKIVQLSIFLCY